MLFNSYIFVLAFLPACLAGYFWLNNSKHYQAGLVFLIGMSLLFYGYFNPWYLWIICGSVIINYVIYRLMLVMARPDEGKCCTKNNEKKRKIIFWIGVVFNLGLLGYFKYMDFFIENVNWLFHADFPLKHILLPLGISFFTFQQISFIVDVYRDDKGTINYSFLEYASYVTYFPQLVAGPIVTHDALVPQLQDEHRKCIDYDYLSKGIALFTLGLVKKVLLADAFGAYVNHAYENLNTLNSTTALLAMLGYTLQIYFDFSGYSDMAVGLGWMMHIDLPVNFNSPYKSTSITEFWKRWHMTLTAFLVKYVYIPLGGNRKGNARTYANILSVFLLSGLWHGAGWTFILWGGVHGLAQIVERLYNQHYRANTGTEVKAMQSEKVLTCEKMGTWFWLFSRWLLTFMFVNITWILFRANSLADAYTIFEKIMCMNFRAKVTMKSYYIISMLLILFLPNAKYIAEKIVERRWTFFVMAILLTWCIFSFTELSVFLYFNF